MFGKQTSRLKKEKRLVRRVFKFDPKLFIRNTQEILKIKPKFQFLILVRRSYIGISVEEIQSANSKYS
jgi:hypothetical protein